MSKSFFILSEKMAATAAAITLLSGTFVGCNCNKDKDEPVICPVENRARYISDRGKLEMIYSMKNIDGIGGLYELDYTADYKLDKIINDYQSVTLEEVTAFIANELFDHTDTKGASLNYGSGCSAFAAATKDGDKLMGRNFDYAHPDDIAAVLVRTAPKDGFKSICMVDAYWLGCKRGFFGDKETDLSIVMGFPYVLMDGMNEKGFAIGVLHLDGEATWQDSGKKKIATTVAMRYLLDNAVDVEDAIAKLQKFDMRCSDRTNGSYHFFMADASGKSATVEYIYDGEGSLPNTFEPLRDSRYVTNFYISPKMADHKYGPKSRHGLDRFNHLRDTLAKYNNVFPSEANAMELLSVASQKKNPEKLTSNTQWSIVYNLTDRTAKVCTLRNYEEGKTWSFSVVK